jgi:hypothetical protein
MGEYITMTLSDDEGDDYYNKEISMDELEYREPTVLRKWVVLMLFSM